MAVRLQWRGLCGGPGPQPLLVLDDLLVLRSPSRSLKIRLVLHGPDGHAAMARADLQDPSPGQMPSAAESEA